ncbi:MAG: cell wall-binding protein, partial [SAR324 cluster bacterium]|nr:cell wall-binding protein [SAR324 cluster bacterium]
MYQLKNILHTFLISCFSLTVISCAKRDHEHDSTANTTPDTTTINFVGGTASGFVLTSADGTNWTLRETAATNPIFDVIYSNSKFVAVGYDGVIRTSSDG